MAPVYSGGSSALQVARAMIRHQRDSPPTTVLHWYFTTGCAGVVLRRAATRPSTLSSLMMPRTLSLCRGSITVSFSPSLLAPQVFRVTMEGLTVYSNWISWLMAAKKLYFIRSCSSSCRVRSEADSSS